MKRGFALVRVGKFRRSAARGMAKAGIPAAVIALVLKIRRSTADEIVACKMAPGALWSAAERSLFQDAA